MTDRTPTSVPGRHPVYPGGPDCQPNCPGPWSQYHDGYADGYENAEARAELDVDVLAAAWLNVWGSSPIDDVRDTVVLLVRNLAEEIAREYAALTRSEP
jgi:hypothetical protein